MDTFFIIILTVIIVVLIVFLIFNIRKKSVFKSKDICDADMSSTITSDALSVECDVENRITVPIEQLLALAELDENNLYEITDKTTIARISSTIPAAAEVAAKAITNKALKNIEIYRAIIPSGATLTDSKKMEGAVRGFYCGAKGIKGQANLVKVDPTNISKASSLANGVANVMNVSSLVVGQYYMAEINAKIETMSKNINKISDFQDREFKSRILSLIARLGEISKFSSEILESEDLRNRKLQTLDDLKGEGTQLLQQVNLEISDMISGNPKPDFKEYQESVNSFCILLEYQQILISVLEEISKLNYLLEKGERSSNMCYSIFRAYLEQTNHIKAALENWHEEQEKQLCIDIEKNRRNKTGIAAIPGFVYDDWKYKELDSGLGQKINTQKAKNKFTLNEPENIYDKDVQIIIRDGKYFYLHDKSDG